MNRWLLKYVGVSVAGCRWLRCGHTRCGHSRVKTGSIDLYRDSVVLPASSQEAAVPYPCPRGTAHVKCRRRSPRSAHTDRSRCGVRS
jgi:hypothetical protein